MPTLVLPIVAVLINYAFRLPCGLDGAFCCAICGGGGNHDMWGVCLVPGRCATAAGGLQLIRNDY
jgi:hypothetical protein